MQSLSGDTRILKESETPDEWIPIVRDSLDRSISRVEEAQGRRFPGVVRVYLCATQQSYNRRTGDAVGGRARGAVFADRVFLSPRCLEWKSTEGILTHELSHLHFRQHLGTDYITEIPGWFQEGLAVHVSQGGGAEPVSRQMAIKAITNGNELHPEPNGNAIPRMAADHGLKHHMFYRQSAMFIEYLEKESQVQFEAFLSMLFAGNPFGESFEHCFGATPKERWDDFRRTLNYPRNVELP